MSDLLGFVLSGLVSGALYALLASGLVLSYSASGLFNFAHGATAYLCALTFYELHSGFGWPTVPTALLLVCVVAPGLGWCLDRLMFRKLARVGETAQIVATIGLLVALPALGLWIVELLQDAGAPVKPAENQFGLPGVGPSPAASWKLTDGVGIDSDQLITWVVTAVVAVGLWVLMRHTSLGLRLRAAVDNRSLVELRGMSADRLSSVAWMVSSGLAGLAGVLATPLLGLSAHDFTLFLFVSATAAVLGRFASVPLAFAGGLGLGVLQNLVAGYASFAERITGFRTAVPFLILFAGLLVLTRRQRTAGTATADAPPVDHLAGRSWVRRWGPWTVAAVLLAGALYTVTTPFWSGIIAQGLAISLVFVSFTVVTGLGAMVSLAQATFVTAAALVAGLLMSHGWPFAAAAALGTCAAAVLGALVALPALRLGGRSLALATLALAFLADQVLFQMGWLRNGDTGWAIPRPVLGPLDLSDDRAMGVAMIVLVTVIVAALSALRDSPSGRAMLAVRSAPAAAMASGVSVVRTKLTLFTLSAGLAGFGGVMYASYSTRITATDFTAMTGLVWLAVVVAAGVRRPQYAVVAGLVFAVMPHVMADYVTESAHLPVILFGLAGLALANDPDGYCAALPTRLHRRRAAAATQGTAAATRGTAPEPPAPREAPSENAALELRGVRAGYDGAPVLHGVDLAVRPGEILALLGPNGAGKSTMCRVAAGLLPPLSGQVYAAGRDLTREGAVGRARAGVLLAPEGRGIFPALTIDENLALHLGPVLSSPSSARSAGATAVGACDRCAVSQVMWRSHLSCGAVRRGGPPARAKPRVGECVPGVGAQAGNSEQALGARDDRDAVYDRFPALAARRGVAAGSLSGGEQQLLALAPLLQRPPTVLIADEPSLGLAPRVVDEVFRLLVELKNAGTALLLVEEKAAEVLEVADTVAYLSQGRVTWCGPRAEVEADRLTEAYLGIGASGAGRHGDVPGEQGDHPQEVRRS
ncbi:ABC transporter permease subunit [Streptomyces bluensis]|uniref:ABC transporter permease subunit n=1 Tax=Streptomyces bluensis TaxID=33897 RepID=UPI003324CF09